MQENCEIQRHIRYDRSKIDVFLKVLKICLDFLAYRDNIYHI